jgi:hypothetical protein
MIRTRCDDWLFADRTKLKIPFLNWSLKVNDLWRKAHAFPDWKEMSVVALRIMTSGESEADAERAISLQRTIARVNAMHSGGRDEHETETSAVSDRWEANMHEAARLCGRPAKKT